MVCKRAGTRLYILMAWLSSCLLKWHRIRKVNPFGVGIGLVSKAMSMSCLQNIVFRNVYIYIYIYVNEMRSGKTDLVRN